MDALDEALEMAGRAAYVAYGSSQDANIRYLTSFRTSDPIIYLKHPKEPGIIIVPAMETARAEKESPCRVLSRADAGFFDLLKEEEDAGKATARLIADLAGGDILVPPEFPIGLADAIRAYRQVGVEKEALSSLRAEKTKHEIQLIRAVQSAADDAMNAAIALIARTHPSGGNLKTPEGGLLTSEDVRYAIHACLLKHGCRGVDTIVASGTETSEVHLRGSGLLAADAPIIIDIFPQSEETGYFADMTRTVVRGEPSPEIRDMYDAVSDAGALAISLARNKRSGSDLYQAVVTHFSDRGYGTEPHGFVHSLGHGVGLEVHEAPWLNARGGELSAGNVITIEPGLYYPGIGGVRIENMGLVTESGFERMGSFPEVFCI